LHRFSLKHYSRLSRLFRWAQSESRPVTHHKSIPPCHSRVWMDMAAILAQVFSLATRRQCPKLRKIMMVLIAMQLKRISVANPVKSKYSTGIQIKWTSTHQRKNPSGAAVLLPVRQKMMLLGHQIRKASCQNVMSFLGQSVTSAASSALTFNGTHYGSLCRHGTRITWRQMIIKERLREFWQSLCMMQGWKSLRDTMPGSFLIFVSKGENIPMICSRVFTKLYLLFF
jgi:hypothetical protein